MSVDYFKKRHIELQQVAREQDSYCPNLFKFLDELSKCFKMKKMAKGELLFHMGDEGTYMLIVLKGAIECAIPKPDEARSKSLSNFMNCMKKLDQENLYREMTKKDLLDYIKPR